MGASPLPSSLLNDILFAFCAVFIVSASLAVVLVRNPVRATLLLILSFLPASLLYILMHAAFVGVLQILVYAGAIMMLFTFVIMMINPKPKAGETMEDSPYAPGGRNPQTLRSALVIAGLLIVVGVVSIPVVYKAAAAVGPGQAVRADLGSLNGVAALLFQNPGDNTLTISFELISFLILVGVVAALNFSRRKTIGKS